VNRYCTYRHAGKLIRGRNTAELLEGRKACVGFPVLTLCARGCIHVTLDRIEPSRKVLGMATPNSEHIWSARCCLRSSGRCRNVPHVPTLQEPSAMSWRAEMKNGVSWCPETIARWLPCCGLFFPKAHAETSPHAMRTHADVMHDGKAIN